jgi:hypothetical protein
MRLEVESDRLGHSDPRWAESWRRRLELENAHKEEWTAFLGPLAGRAYVSFRGGLPYSISADETTDDEVPYLVGAPEVLSLAVGEGVSDAGLRWLRRLPHLQALTLQGSAITDDGVRTLARLRRLRSLDLYETSVTDAGLGLLRDHPRLLHLDCDTGSDDLLRAFRQRRMERFRRLRPARRRRDAVTFVRLKQTNGPLTRQGGLVRDANFRQGRTTDEDLEYLTALPELESLDLYETDVTDRGLLHLAGLKSLRSLDLGRCDIRSLDALAGMTALDTLDLGYLSGGGWESPLTDAGTRALATLTGLRVLRLSAANITDVTLRRLRGLRGLRVLDLNNVLRITDNGMAALAGLTALERLHASFGRAITDEGLRHIGRLTKLVVLNLRSQPVSNAGLAYLRGLEDLECLELDDTQVTAGGARYLLTFLPRGSITAAGQIFKHTDPEPRFVRQQVYDVASLETPQRWGPIRWQDVMTRGALDQNGSLWEDGYEHRGGWTTSAGPGMMRLWRRKVPAGATAADVLRDLNRSQTVEEGPAPQVVPLSGVDVASGRRRGAHSTYLAFAWVRQGVAYVVQCEAPHQRFDTLAPLFLHAAASFRFQDQTALTGRGR